MNGPADAYPRWELANGPSDPNRYEVFKGGWEAALAQFGPAYVQEALQLLRSAVDLVDRPAVRPLEAADIHVRVAELYVHLAALEKGQPPGGPGDT